MKPAVIPGTTFSLMKVSAAMLAALTCGVCLALAACGGSSRRAPESTEPPAARTPLPAPDVTLTSDEKQVWKQLPGGSVGHPGPALPRDRAGERLRERRGRLLRHRHRGLRQADDDDPACRLRDDRPADVHRLRTEQSVDLPPRPLLLTFDDARADSWTGADGILRKLHFNAVMFVDVGRVDGGDSEYLTWQELATVQNSGRWQLQLHSGKGHTQIHTARDPKTTGRSTPMKSRARTSTAGETGSIRTSPGARDARRSRLGLPAAGLRTPVRQLRPGRHQRRADPRRPPRLAHRPLRVRLHPGRQRTSATGGPTAARPHPGHPRHHRRRPARDAALWQVLTAPDAVALVLHPYCG